MPSPDTASGTVAYNVYERPNFVAATGFENNAYETLQTTQDSEATNEATGYITVNYAGPLEKRENNTKQNLYEKI